MPSDVSYDVRTDTQHCCGPSSPSTTSGSPDSSFAGSSARINWSPTRSTSSTVPPPASWTSTLHSPHSADEWLSGATVPSLPRVPASSSAHGSTSRRAAAATAGSSISGFALACSSWSAGSSAAGEELSPQPATNTSSAVPAPYIKGRIILLPITQGG